jgi:methyl coenzyme M reductase subunit D
MDAVVQPVSVLNESRNAVEIVIYIKELLGEEQRQNLVTQLEGARGIISAEFCPLRYHLVVARYDRDAVNSQDVLKSFNALNVDARLIGPI